ncbi:cysteine-rich secretory protein lccl domain-containing 2 [Plakobranchus ocellatus]|uniref:Cysteine-rich secretory protein lccl domain-containing 2 n=1 Tax=Plakobranchus ocellatus TaxID=259542 RepID=A0AAV4D730_9GAST|nr:cysteine-rich secretory protein lccl domain-containing 2 [Plakobranchus ocellatus]
MTVYFSRVENQDDDSNNTDGGDKTDFSEFVLQRGTRQKFRRIHNSSMMARETILPLALLVACVVSAAQAEWDQADRDTILQLHNKYRKDEGGCQMNKLNYDSELEEQAKAWATGCVFEHEMIPGRGENLAYATDDEPDAKLITNSVDNWFGEKKDFSRGQENCDHSCHYTQLVWDTTSKVGCYAHRCAHLELGTDNAWYLVCFYTPAGNTWNVDPYQIHCDSPCRDGQTAEDGLCVGEAIIPCVDGNDYCEMWASTGECEKNPTYMKDTCRKSCKEC